MTLVGSRFTSSAESRYAPIEGEALAVVDALEKSRHFVLGCDNLIIAVDHKPLVKVFGDRSLHDIENPRLRNLKEKTLRFRFRIVHVPGARNAAADSVSRNPVGVSEEMQLPDDQPTESIGAPETMCLASIRVHDNRETEICSSFDNKSRDVLSKITWESVRLSTASDSSCQPRQIEPRSYLPRCAFLAGQFGISFPFTLVSTNHTKFGKTPWLPVKMPFVSAMHGFQNDL